MRLPSLFLALCLPSASLAAQVEVEVLTIQTQYLGSTGSIIGNVGMPWTNHDGSVGVVVDNTDGTVLLLLDGQVVYDDAGSSLMQFSNDSTGSVLPSGRLAYAGLVPGSVTQARLYAGAGNLFTTGDAAPTYPSPARVTAVSRPEVHRGGGLSWWSGVSLSGGTSSAQSALYFSPGGTFAGATRVLGASDVVTDPSGSTTVHRVEQEARVTDDGSHYIAGVELAAPSDTRHAVVVDGVMVARTGSPSGISSGDEWSTFGLVDMNQHGAWVFAGSGTSTGSRDVVVHQGVVIVRAGLQAQDGTYVTPGIVKVLGINDAGTVVHLWRRLATNPDPERLFATCDPTRPDETTHLLLEEGDTLDFDGDGIADATLDGFMAANTQGALPLGKPMGDDYVAHVSVDLEIGGFVYEALIAVDSPCCDDTDQDDVCNDVDPCPLSALDDADGDGVCEDVDLCLGDDATGDADADGLCEDRDQCFGTDSTGDTDADGVCDSDDLCDGDDATGDTDGDGVCDSDDLCDGDDATGDTDGDGVCGDLDLCLGDDATGDTDADAVCDDRDQCLGQDSTGDIDADGICGDLDDCIGDDLSGDADADGVCNDTDACPFDRFDDSDGDGSCDSDDLCFGLDISDDSDGDGICNDQDFVLFTTRVTQGEDMTLVALNAPPGATVEFLVSQRGPGNAPCVGSVCGNLDSPISIATLPVPSSGTVRIDARAPRFLVPGSYLYFQAVWSTATSADVSEVDLRRVRTP